jgi:hypothetical protein
MRFGQIERRTNFSRRNKTVEIVPLQGEDLQVHLDNHRLSDDLLHQQPRLKYRSFQNNFSNMIVVSFVLLHPLDVMSQLVEICDTIKGDSHKC